MHLVHCRCGEWKAPEYITKWNRFGSAEECTTCWATRAARETAKLIPARVRKAIRKAFRDGA